MPSEMLYFLFSLISQVIMEQVLQQGPQVHIKQLPLTHYNHLYQFLLLLLEEQLNIIHVYFRMNT